MLLYDDFPFMLGSYVPDDGGIFHAGTMQGLQ
jgi:hypothetical protein